MKTPRTLTIATAILAITAALGISPAAPGFVPAAFAATDTITVNTVNDLTTCKVPGPFSLRCAIGKADVSPAGDTKFIKFAIGVCPGGVCKIAVLQKPLPPLTASNTTIDGYTQPGAKPNTTDLHKVGGDNATIKIQLDGLKAPGVNGLVVEGSNDTIRGLSITHFKSSSFAAVGGAAILITSPPGGSLPPTVAANTVIGNFLGLLPDGKKPGPNTYGVAIGADAHVFREVVGSPTNADRNLISGNASYGIYLLNSTLNLIQGNYIGTDSTGTRPDANGTGIYMVGEGTGSPAVPPITGDTIGGAGAAGNIISGNTNWGIAATGRNTTSKITPKFTLIGFNRNAQILGNFIGTNLTGIGAIANGAGGIYSNFGLNFSIGDLTPGDPNVIAGNGGDGIDLVGSGGGNTIAGNYIGLSPGGAVLPNKGNGVDLTGAFQNNTDVLGDTVIKNRIANNLLQGVQVGAGNTDNTHDVITHNSMYANKDGIDLFGQDFGDKEPNSCLFGPTIGASNDYIPCVLIKSATTAGITIEACHDCTVELFLAPSAADVEGKTYLTTVTMPPCAVNCGGFTTLTIPSPSQISLSKGQFVVATATSPTGQSFPTETSMFSRAAPVGVPLQVNTSADNASPCSASAYSLRCAITDANKTLGDQITFNIPTTDSNCLAGVCTLSANRALPIVQSDSTSINGYSQPGTTQNTNALIKGTNTQIGIQLGGTGHAGSSDGLQLQGMWDDVEGLSIQEFIDPNAGIHVNGPKASWDMVMGNFVGVAPGSGLSYPNGNGVLIDGGATHALIGFRAVVDTNVISNSHNYGVMAEESTSSTNIGSNVVFGNLIGTNPAGNAGKGNGISGIFLYGSHRNVIGGPGGALGNVISGNGSDGIDGVASNFNLITGNFIGHGVNGGGDLPNGVAGIFLYGGLGNIIGGLLPFYGNIISGNLSDGVDALAEPGIAILNNTIGAGPSTSGNGGDGVFVGNTTNLAQLRKHRIPARLFPRAGSPIVGYTNMQGNVSNNSITGNGNDGIQIGQSANDQDVHIVMSQNAMGGNSTAGILFTGSTPNQCGFLPSNSPNDGVACPSIGGATNNGPTLSIFGYDFGCIGCVVEVFQSSSQHNGYGEGETYLGNATVGGNGQWELDLNTAPVDIGQYVTATVTRPSVGASLPETSEFSYNYQVTGCNAQAPNC